MKGRPAVPDELHGGGKGDHRRYDADIDEKEHPRLISGLCRTGVLDHERPQQDRHHVGDREHPRRLFCPAPAQATNDHRQQGHEHEHHHHRVWAIEPRRVGQRVNERLRAQDRRP